MRSSTVKVFDASGPDRSPSAAMPPPRFARAQIPRRPQDWPNQSLGALFAAVVQRQAEDVALVDGAERLSFAELAHRVETTAAGLRRLEVGAGDVVAYQLPNWWEAVVVFLAAARIGAVVNPLLPIFRERELRFTLAQSGASLIFAPGVFRGFDYLALIESLRPDLPALRHVVACRTAAAAGTHGFAELLTDSVDAPAAVDPDSLLLLMYTSGTTADPKGVLHTHNTLAAEILSLRRVHGLGPGDRTLMPSPLTHISGVIHAILTPAILGTCAVVMDRWDPLEALGLLAAEGVTYMAGAPTFLQEMVQHPRVGEFATTALRLYSCGGAAVSADLVRTARAKFPSCVAKRVYGSTEFPTLSTTGPDDARSHGIETEGRVITPAEIRIARDDGTAAVSGEEGEVQARGPECFVGYADTCLNQDAFTADGWFRTGDLGTLDRDGYLRITGRLKEIVVRKGEKLSVREIEEALAMHPSVAEVAVVPLADAATGERACAVVVLRPGATLTLADIGPFLAAGGLARQKHPEQLEIVDALPRTDSGKVARAAVITLLSGRS